MGGANSACKTTFHRGPVFFVSKGRAITFFRKGLGGGVALRRSSYALNDGSACHERRAACRISSGGGRDAFLSLSFLVGSRADDLGKGLDSGGSISFCGFSVPFGQAVRGCFKIRVCVSVPRNYSCSLALCSRCNGRIKGTR